MSMVRGVWGLFAALAVGSCAAQPTAPRDDGLRPGVDGLHADVQKRGPARPAREARMSRPRSKLDRLRGDVDKLFLIADRSRDGLISRSEFIGYSIAEAFARTDAVRDGFLTLDEFTAAGGSVSTFRSADRSGAGRIGVNDAQKTPALQQQMSARFSQADTSRDNYLDKPEFVIYAGKPPAVLR